MKPPLNDHLKSCVWQVRPQGLTEGGDRALIRNPGTLPLWCAVHVAQLQCSEGQQGALLNVCFHWLEYWEVMLHTRHIKHTICQGEFVFYKHGTQPTDAVDTDAVGGAPCAVPALCEKSVVFHCR